MTRPGARVLARFLILLSLAAALPAACGGDSPSPAVVPAPTQPVQPQDEQQQEQPREASDEPEVGGRAAEGSDPARSDQGQPAASDEVEASDPAQAGPAVLDEPDLPPDEPSEPSGSPPPALDIARAAAAVVELAYTLGPRPSGTVEELAAAEHIAAVLRSYGYDARLEPFEFSVDQPIAQIFLSDSEDLFASRFRGSNTDGIEARLLRIDGDGSPSDYAGLDTSGAIAIVDRGQISFAEKVQHAVAAGAAALIIVNQNNDWLVGDLVGYSSPIPVLGVSRLLGQTLLNHAPRMVRISPSLSEVSQSQNIIAQRPGAVCRVIVGAHYDTVYRTAGYNDNSSGTALMMEFARIYADHEAADHLCFVGFGAEEVGIFGSQEYVRRLQQSGEIADLQYLLNLDAIGSGRQSYVLFVTGTDLRLLVTRLADQLGIEVASVVRRGGADAYPFAQAGIRTFFPLPAGGVLNTIADDASNFDAEVFGGAALLAEQVLQCMLERSGASIRPVVDCSVER